MYQLIRPLLFLLDPERAHLLALQSLQLAYQLGLSRFFPKVPDNPRALMGVHFPNPIGLAAGFDCNADYLDALGELGFGFIEIGSVTPRPQSGNPKPRLFRLKEYIALINRKGFDNKGVEHVVSRLEKTKYKGVLGINLGKNRDTTNENAIEDYLIGFRALWKFASYFTINISSPNTVNLRELQSSEYLIPLLTALKQEQARVLANHNKYIPFVVKISPDLSDAAVIEIAKTLVNLKIDGVIATNTTTERASVKQSIYANEQGGLSGQPLNERSTAVIKLLHAELQNTIPIIASGGITNINNALEKINAGASLLQIYSGLIYSGPGFIAELADKTKI